MSRPIDHFDRAAAILSLVPLSLGAILKAKMGPHEFFTRSSSRDVESAEHDLCDALNFLRGEFEAVAEQERARFATLVELARRAANVVPGVHFEEWEAALRALDEGGGAGTSKEPQ